jgi:polyhydroxybutyrate depolymerase
LIPREYRLALLAIMVGLAVFALSIAAALAGEMRALRVGTAARSWYLHAPAGLKPGAPLVFVLHGAGGNGERAVRQYGWQALADTEGFVVVGPDAATPFSGRPADLRTNPRLWNDGSQRGGPNIRGSDDTAFVAAIIELLVRTHGIDRSRVYVAGFSMGASMTQRLGQEMAGRIGAIVPVAGMMTPLARELSRPMPVLYISGDSDPLNPVAGGEIASPWGNGFRKEPLQRLVERWRDLDGCTGAPGIATAPSLKIQTWSACRGGVEVQYVLVQGRAHVWRGTDAYDTTANAWAFLRRWRLPAP